MAGTLAKAERKAKVFQRLADALGIEAQPSTKGDPELALIAHLERIADALPACPDSLQGEGSPPLFARGRLRGGRAPRGTGETGSLYAAIAQASEEELTTIPGIGPATAARIKQEMAKASQEVPPLPQPDPDPPPPSPEPLAGATPEPPV